MENINTLDWNEYIETARKAVSEGIVMLKNDNQALPLRKGSNVAVFGRMQNNYYKSGTGSGGLVNVTKVYNILDGLIESNHIVLNKELAEKYTQWERENPFNKGIGWGAEPWSQKEMILDDDFVNHISKTSDTAIIIIGRTAGEEQDNSVISGSYLLSGHENDMIEKVRKNFKKVIILLNVGGLIDMGFVKKYSPDAVLYVWQGGMIGGLGTADVLIGKTGPSGKLTDTIAYSAEDYPSHKYFGDLERNFYFEDIYVGYRYFETFAKNKVMYPFGFGLTYTNFSIKTVSANLSDNTFHFQILVKNIGDYIGKEVVQVYFKAPQGKLGKPVRALCAFQKTENLKPQEEQILNFSIDINQMASYDDSGATGNKSCYVLEAGDYEIYIGSDVRTSEQVFVYKLLNTVVIKKLTQALAPVLPFERIKPEYKDNSFRLTTESVPLSEIDEAKRRISNMPSEIPFTGDMNIKLIDVLEGRKTIEQFISQLTDEDLSCIIRGEGMGSPKVTAGTASAFGGISDKLSYFGIPCVCCSDGPSGMRLDCGTKAFSLPNGTLLASTFNKKLLEELFVHVGKEMAANNVECLLGPGINIHRYPLNGRNFEYFSEDPYLTGIIAASELKGLHSVGVTGTIKHFCGNNQETGRHVIDSVISERALREIYLKGFEIAIKYGGANTIMTTYGSVNGLWTAASYDLTTTILRDEWGFKGMAMTDWWANINERNKPIDRNNFAAMARAQNDIYMVCPDGSKNATGDNTLLSLKNGELNRSELQRNAINICYFAMNTRAMMRLNGGNSDIIITNRPAEDDGFDASDVVFYEINDSGIVELNDIMTVRGESYVFALDLKKIGQYRITICAKSDMGELAQMPVTLFCAGLPCAVFSFHGTSGEWTYIQNELYLVSRFSSIRLYFSQGGLTIKNIKFEFLQP